jgi:hypothetical protein
MSLLWSFHYARRARDLARFLAELPARRRVFADSGAFSAHTVGAAVDVDDYADWLARWSPWLTLYANLDVLGDPRATRANQQRLEDRGLHPTPVFHAGSPWAELERYLAEGYTYIALGGLVGKPLSAVRPWLAKVFRIVSGAAALHGFGVTNWDLLRRFRWHSVDSTTWVGSARYGLVTLYDPRRDRWVRFPARDRQQARTHAALLARYDVPLTAIASRTYSRRTLAVAAAASVYRANHALRERHGAVPLPPGRGYPPCGAHALSALDEPGPVTYLAGGDYQDHRCNAAGLALAGAHAQ